MKVKFNANNKFKILFYRDFQFFTGGHLKVWDYFNHVLNSEHYLPQIYFSPDSNWNNTNPWLNFQSQILKSLPLIEPDILFIAGLDWLFFQEFLQTWTCPIINLIQHCRHGNIQDPRYQFLSNKAIRICVSQEVATAITKTNQVNGNIFVIPNGIDFNTLPSINYHQRKYDLVIAALKQPELGLRLQEKLVESNLKIALLTNPIPRNNFLEYLNHAKMTLFLPEKEEGFYLPALEGMMLNTLVICPDCIGNRSFCLPNYNCLRPNYTLEDIVSAIQIALQLSETEKQQFKTNAKQTANQHNLIQERQAFLEILNNVDKLW